MSNSSKVQQELKEYIKKYVSYDNYVKQQNQKLTEIREKKRAIEEHILYTIKTYRLENIQINLPDGELSLSERDQHSALSIGFLKQALLNYFSAGTKNPIEATKKADECLEYILNQRDTKRVSSLKRTFTKYH